MKASNPNARVRSGSTSMSGSAVPLTTTTVGNHRAHPNLLCAGFNQDSTCISVGSRKGYAIYSVDPFGRYYTRTEDGAASIVEMLFCTSLVAVVGAGDRSSSSPRKLRIVNTKRQSTICELQFPTSILTVRLNRRRLIVVLEEQIYIYDISNMKMLHTIETSPNPAGICSLASSSESSYLAYPSPQQLRAYSFSNGLPSSPPSAQNTQAGDVIIFDALNLSVTNVIQAHKTPLACVAVNASGTMLATASDKGTVIRVFSIPNGDKVAQFRRGTKSARIFSISFNASSTLLAVTSDSDTVHIFRLDGQSRSLDSGTSKADQARRSAQASAYADGLDEEDENAAGSRFPADGGNGRAGYDAYLDSTQRQRSGSKGMTGTLKKRGLAVGRSLAGSIGGFFPGTVTEMWDPQRDFASLRLPTPGVKSTVTFGGGSESGSPLQILVLTSEGIYYCYNIDTERGGECVLQKSYSIVDNQDDTSSASGD